MDNKENDIIYTAADIAQYLDGKLSPLQMHAMEKAALDDPFLAEAMEGYESVPQEDWAAQLAGLKNDFGREKNQAKVIAMPVRRKNNWWKVAAAVLFLGTTGSIAYLLLNKEEKQTIAKNIQPQAEKEKVVADTNAFKNLPETSSENATAVAKNEAKQITSASNQYTVIDKTAAKKETIQADSLFVYRPAKKSPIIDLKPDGVASVDNDAIKDRSPLPPATAPSVNYSNNANEKQTEETAKYFNSNIAKNGISTQAQYEKGRQALVDKETSGYLKREAPLNKSFAAQVVGADNSPLPFANISIKSENFGTYADAKGNFRLVSSDSLLVVEVKAAGYQPRFYTLQSFVQQNKIVLAEEDAASRYKAVVGNSSTAKAKTSRRATLVRDSLINVEPADGWDNYNTYVNNNIEIPDDITKKDIHGQVELSFDVKSNGTITNIKVDKSLCDNCDEVAKRLIEQGPQWKVKKGKKGKGKVTVQF
ncbi:carboxypeptidase-like regulatory domain-containing protein [Ferruginibacter sp. SUN106]|uniref:carboxypeptidase-like regulatory domain-containing protein n=1 Tax=Ferruginibacter sp. SUN106 TaxID=2978348 RepID=UPI003D35BA00